MADFIALTPTPVQITTTGAVITSQDLSRVLDISDYDVIDLAWSINKLSAGTLDLKLYTNFQNAVDDDSWVKWLCGYSLGITENNWITISMPNALAGVPLFKYLRWTVKTSVAATAQFFIAGLFRTRSIPGADGIAPSSRDAPLIAGDGGRPTKHGPPAPAWAKAPGPAAGDDSRADYSMPPPSSAYWRSR